MKMQNQLKVEELAMFLLGIVLFIPLKFSWWIFPLLLFVPDLSMVGYLINDRFGSHLYNVVHHKGFGLIIYFMGFVFHEPLLNLTGTILFSHSSLDRILGYGLKYRDSFKHTHLGWIGSNNMDKN